MHGDVSDLFCRAEVKGQTGVRPALRVAEVVQVAIDTLGGGEGSVGRAQRGGCAQLEGQRAGRNAQPGSELLLDLVTAEPILPDLEGVDLTGQVVAVCPTAKAVVDALHALRQLRRAHAAHQRAVEIHLQPGAVDGCSHVHPVRGVRLRNQIVAIVRAHRLACGIRLGRLHWAFGVAPRVVAPRAVAQGSSEIIACPLARSVGLSRVALAFVAPTLASVHQPLARNPPDRAGAVAVASASPAAGGAVGGVVFRPHDEP